MRGCVAWALVLTSLARFSPLAIEVNDNPPLKGLCGLNSRALGEDRGQPGRASEPLIPHHSLVH